MTAGCGLTEVDALCNQDADGDGQLEHDVELAANLGGRHLREVQRHTLSGQACNKEHPQASILLHANSGYREEVQTSPQDKVKYD